MVPRVLHLYPHTDAMLTQYVGMLDATAKDAATEDATATYDIVHVHGCWNHDIIRQASRHQARLVLSPHGQLHPWAMKQERLAAMMPWQRDFVSSCYAVIARGRMEAEHLQQLGWNTHIEIVRNPIITATITEAEARQQLSAIYRKVLDSDVWPLMSSQTRQTLACLLKAGITGDARWVQPQPVSPTSDVWRQILLYAYHENISETVHKGCRVLGLTAPALDVEHTPVYLPENYQQPQPLDDVMALFATLHKRITIRHLTDLHTALRRDDIDDEKLAEALKTHRLLKFARQLMPILQERTLLDEGYMPVTP